MSLISEALKKARQEAARQDAARQGVPYAVGSVEAQTPRNTLLMILAGLGAGCLLAGAVFMVAFFGGWGPFARPRAAAAPQVAQTAPPPAAALPSPVQPPAAPPAEIQEEEPVPAPVAAPPLPAPAPETRPAPPPATEIRPTAPVPTPSAPEPRPEPVPVALPPAPVEEERPAEPPPAPGGAPETPAVPSAGAGGLVEGRTYAGEVPVPGGGVVRLNGIAFSQERPVAVLEGRVMGTGEVIQGFTVVEIESGRVKLQGHGATVYVSPK